MSFANSQNRILIASAAGGPLLQKSSHAATLAVNTENKALIIPTTFDSMDLGTVSSLASPAKFQRSISFSIAIQNYWRAITDSAASMTTEDPCQDKICQGRVTSAGISYLGTGPFTYETTELVDLTIEGPHKIFDLWFYRYLTENSTFPALDMMAAFVESIDENCMATMRMQGLTYRAATVSRGVFIQNSTVSFPTSPEFTGSKFIRNADNPGDFYNVPNGTPAGPLTAVDWLGSTYFQGDYVYRYTAEVDSWNGTSPLQYLNENGWTNCTGGRRIPTFISPMKDVDSKLGAMMFRVAKDLAAPTDVQNFTALVTEPGKSIFHPGQ